MQTYTRHIRLLTLFAAILLSVTVSAQGRFPVKGRLIIDGKDAKGNKTEAFEDEVGQNIYYFWNEAGANEALAKYKGKSNFVAEGYVITGEKGAFEIPSAMEGFTLVVRYFGMERKVIITEKNKDNVEIRLSDDEAVVIKNVNVDAKQKRRPAIKTGKTRAVGRNIVFNVYFEIPQDYWNEKSRLFVAPVAIDCMTEDTVEYLQGRVADAPEYHKLQERRMAFDFNRYDPVNEHAGTYIDRDSLPLEDSMYVVKFAIPYTRPNESKAYSCRGQVAMEDYTHEFYHDEGTFGSCFIAEPLRFLEWNVKGLEIPLTDEFYEPPSSNLHDINVNLSLQFIRGKSTLKPSDQNDKEFERLINELKRYGNNLVAISVLGGASPDGSVSINQRLSKERANVALSVIKKNLPNWQRINTHIDSKPYTWEDVVDSLLQRGDSISANQMKLLIAKGGNIYQSVKNDSVINSILDNMMVMRFTYSYQDSQPLEPEEALAAYKADSKGEYLFSHGDYYNILKLTENDPEEFRKVILRAYKEICQGMPSNYNSNKFAMFLANRMSIYSLNEEKPDTTILLPFLHSAYGLNQRMQIGISSNFRMVNRMELVATHACMALKLQCLDYARFWAALLPEDNFVRKEINTYESLVNAILRWDDPTLPEEEKQAGVEAAYYLMRESEVNNAVLHTELMEELSFKREEAIACCNRLPDSNPKKWYLLALLHSAYAGTSQDIVAGAFEDFGTGFSPLSDKQLDALPTQEMMEYFRKEKEYNEAKEAYEAEHGKTETVDDIPQFMGMLQHAFDMRPYFKRYYAHEALIPKGIYDKYAYNPRQAARYRKKFDAILQAKVKEQNKVEANNNESK